MKKHPNLAQAEKLLNPLFYTRFVDSNILIVSIDKNYKPFAHLVVEPQFDGIGLSIALDFDDTYAVAELTISLMHCAPVALADPFYYSKSGELHWNDSAIEYFQLEADSDLLINLEPPTDAKH